MRRVKITKNVLKKGAVFMNFTKTQIAIIVVGAAIAGGTLAGFIYLGLPINLTMTIVFFELLFVVATGVIRINGMSFVKHIILSFKKPQTRYYSTKGIWDKYDD